MERKTVDSVYASNNFINRETYFDNNFSKLSCISILPATLASIAVDSFSLDLIILK